MLAKSIDTLEETFRTTGNNGEYTLKTVTYKIPDVEPVNVIHAAPVKRANYFHAEPQEKKRIILHFTAGNLRSDMGALTRDDYHVSVAYVIGRDGTIYELFDSAMWSGHIGKGVGNLKNNEQDKCTIGIELSNYGYLTPHNGKLETYYSRLPDKNGKPGPVDVYCDLTETENFQKLDKPFRGQSHYATFTNKQYNALELLLRYLTHKHSIPFQFLDESKRYVTTKDVLSFNGIVSHINYRESGKWDIGPAFDWARITRHALVSAAV